MINKGMGRVRAGRFALVAAPAAVVSLGMGVAVLQGWVTASLSAAEPFQLASTGGTADRMGLSLASQTAAKSVGDNTAVNKKAAKARLRGGNLENICIAAGQNFPILGKVGLKISSGSPVAVGNIDLQADALNLDEAQLPATDIGVTASEPGIGGVAGGWGLQTDNVKGGVKLKGLDAKAYGIRLDSGLGLKSLAVAPALGDAKC